VSVEDKYAIALGVLCVVLLMSGTVFARVLSQASPRVVRIVFPVAALTTGLLFAGFVLIARLNAH
jgi:ATP/ADP translocase